ncbi:MAG: hypothetical protein ACK5ZC_13215 [Pirellulaceae bacterium]|jgi:hypothetical protein
MMIRSVGCIALAALVSLFPATGSAKEPAKGLQSGDALGAFTVQKVGGATEDGVEVGESLCYRCKFQSRPMVLVFTRSTGDSVGKLAKELDSAIAKHEKQQLRGLVSVMGSDAKQATDVAKKFVESQGLKYLPIAIPSDIQTGPRDYRISPDADVTVVVAKEGEVVQVFTYKQSEVKAEEVIQSVEKMLKG